VGDYVDVDVVRSASRLATIVGEWVNDEDSDGNAFHIGGNFGGRLNVADELDTLGGPMVGGLTLATAKLNIGGGFVGGGPAAEFTGTFSGELSIGSDLDVDLTFGGTATQATIAGSVNTNVAAGGRIGYLATGSLFDQVGAGGNFEDGAGVVTGTLTAPMTLTKVRPTK
jgi:hypothetical protein